MILGIPMKSLEKRIDTLASKKMRLAEARGGFAEEPSLPTEEANLASFDGSAPSAKKRVPFGSDRTAGWAWQARREGGREGGQDVHRG